MRLGDVQRPLELPREHGGGTDVSGLSGLHHVMQRLHRLLDRSPVVPTMDLVHVDVFRPEPLQAVVDLAEDRLARQPLAVRSFTHLAMQLGGDDDFVAIGEVPQSAAEDLLAPSDGVHIRRIEEIDAKLERFLDDRAAVLLVEHPFMDPTFRVPEPHAPEADPRHVHPGAAQLRVLHVTLRSPSDTDGLNCCHLLPLYHCISPAPDRACSNKALLNVGPLTNWSAASAIVTQYLPGQPSRY